jgi:hypothetical protein
MALSSNLASIKINNNSIDIGRASDGTTPVSYTYDSCALLGGDAIVTGNTIAGCVGGSSSAVLLRIASASCNIRNNNFIRGAGSPIAAFIVVTGSNDQIISDNIFDQPTIDGSSDVLVTGLSATSTYKENKNQTIYIPITLTDKIVANIDSADAANYLSDATGKSVGSYITEAVNYKTNVEQIVLTTAGTSLHMNIDLNSALPKNISLLSLKLGITAKTSGAGVFSGGDSQNNIYINLKSKNVGLNSTSYSSPTGTVLQANTLTALDETSFHPNPYYAIQTNIATLLAGTVYITATPTNANYFVNNSLYEMHAHIRTTITLSAASYTFFYSPLVAQCRW